ncbi:hypothetical protein GCM10010272_62590 [Streptomyces lateritius]|nr:hypothetical protein GCM10010272_62590 [Streptomyces lateritius]
MDEPEADEPAPAGAEPGGRAEVGEGQQQRDAGQHLDERDEVGAYAGDPLGDDRRQGVENGGGEGEPEALEGGGVAGPDAGDEDEPHEGDGEPAELRRGDPLPEEHRAEHHEEERLGVVDDGGEGDRGGLVRLEEQDPVEDDEHAAEDGESELLRREAVPGEVAAGQAVHAEGDRPEQATEEHHVERRRPGLDDEDAEGAGEHHGEGQLDGSPGLRCALVSHAHDATDGARTRSTSQWGVLPMGPSAEPMSGRNTFAEGEVGTGTPLTPEQT